MLEIKDIEKLAKLARIELTENEKEAYVKDISSILGYVDQIKGAVAQAGDERKVPEHHNIMRPDEAKNKGMENTEAIVNEFPDKYGNYLKVKKILG